MNFKVFMIIFLAGIVSSSCNEKDTVPHPGATISSEIQWVYSLSEGLKLSKEKNKPLMVEFYADWCGYCKKLDNETYSNPDIVKLSEEFICVKINTDKDPDDARKYRVSGLPTIIFLNSNGDIIEKVIGYRNSNDFINIMSGIIKK
ncbi:MAG: thioredoxin family protein [Endomicrobiia bacterium]